MSRHFFQAVGILAGTAMGAGVFSLPYVVSRVGLFLGFLFLAFFALVYFLVHWMYASILLTFRDPHDFFYGAKRFLPKRVARTASFIIIAELLFSLLVYLVLAPTFSGLLFGVSGVGAVFLFWFLGSVFIFLGASEQSWAGFLGTLVIVGIILVVYGASAGEELAAPPARSVSLGAFLLPFGPILFSFAARGALPEVVSLWRQAKKRFSLPLVLFLGSILPAAVYVFFVIGILRLDPVPSPEALGGLGLPAPLVRLLGALGLVAIWTSYFVLGRNIRDNLRLDLGLSKMLSWAVPICFPLLFYVLGFRGFLETVGVAGGFFLALEGVFICWMWGRAFPKQRSPWIVGPLYAVFLSAIGYQIFALATSH